jgi:hypothetical protein
LKISTWLKISTGVGGLVAALVAMTTAAVGGELAVDTERAYGRNAGVTVQGIRLGRHPDKLRVVLDATGPVNFDYWISERGRTIVVLIPQVAWSAPSDLRPGPDSPIYRINFFPNATGGGVLSILGREELGLSAIEQLGPDRSHPYRVVFDIPSRQRDAWMPSGGIMRDGKLLPSHAAWPPVQQAAAGRALPVITRPVAAKVAPVAEKPAMRAPAQMHPPAQTPQEALPQPGHKPQSKPMPDQHLSYATER